MALTFQLLPIQPRRLFRLVGGAIFALALAGCGSDGGSEDAAPTSLVDEATTTTEETSTSTAPAETDPPTDDSGSDDAEAGSPSGDICASWENLGELVGMLDDEPAPDTDFEGVWDSIQEAASELTQNSPEGYEDELARMEQAWGEFRVVAREHNFDMDAAEDGFDVIAENLDLNDPEIVGYLETECTS